MEEIASERDSTLQHAQELSNQLDKAATERDQLQLSLEATQIQVDELQFQLDELSQTYGFLVLISAHYT